MFVLFSCCCSFSCKKQFCDRSQGPPPGASGGVGAFTPNMFSFLYCASFIVCRKHNVVGTVRIVMFQTTLCVGITVSVLLECDCATGHWRLYCWGSSKTVGINSFAAVLEVDCLSSRGSIPTKWR